MGNATATDETEIGAYLQAANQNVLSLDSRVDLSGYLSRTSDIVALMVLEHQMHLSNMFTRVAWEYRLAQPEARTMTVSEPSASDPGVIEATRVGAKGALDLKLRPLPQAAVEIVDYMLFVDEAPFAGRVEGVSGFAERFPKQGPRDARGRSLRDLELTTRLMRYPLSYMIYSEQFDALPADVRGAIYERLWTVLSGGDPQTIYTSRLPLADRQAIVEILRDTRPGLPEYFQPVTR
jgi:hypothetical protein